jgi:hypothetical protein
LIADKANFEKHRVIMMLIESFPETIQVFIENKLFPVLRNELDSATFEMEKEMCRYCAAATNNKKSGL